MFTRVIAIAALTLAAAAGDAIAADDAGLEFFEKQVRPILVSRCYECHSGKSVKLQGGLRLDSLAGAIKGGETGPAVVPGKPKESLLIDAINYGEPYQMPPKTKLPASEIATLTEWVEMGAPWPAEQVTTAEPGKYFDLQKRKADHWCWQPLTKPTIPQISNVNPIDAFIRAKLQDKALSPAPPADSRTLIRRAYFDLIGLPPPPEEVGAFVRGDKTFEAVVDQLLASPHFGERWGRHWLDLVRYAESRGHEFDYNIPNAHEYRDYVIRAFNANVPYDQFVIEHIAGDLVDQPRLHPAEGFNESILGTGFWFLGEWLHSPVDIRKDECDRIDNQIDVFSKTFLGVTVSCARCHDHKFDAISQADYYAFSGYLQSSSYRLTRFETWQHDRKVAADLKALDARHVPLIGAAIATQLETRLDGLAEQLIKGGDPLKAELATDEITTGPGETIVDYASSDVPWMSDGPTFGDGPLHTGQLVLNSDAAIVLEAATYSSARRDHTWNELSAAAGSEGDVGRLAGHPRAGRCFKTPTWTLKSGYVHYLIEGAGQVYAAVDSHAMINGPLHAELAKETGGSSDLPMRWISHDLSRYSGHRVHLEFSPKEDEDFRVLKVVEGLRPPAPTRRNNRLIEQVQSVTEPTSAAQELLKSTLSQIAAGRLEGEHLADRAALANWLIRQVAEDQKLPEEVEAPVSGWRSERKKLEAAILSKSRLALTMWDGSGVDEHLLIRGNHRTLGPIVPRRFLEAFSDASQKRSVAAGSSRLELAQQVVDPANPLVSRVIVNRVWQHLMGRGIVLSVDNFGVLGQPPTHPELLDHLATEFIADGWSIKRLIRRIMLSDTYQQGSGVRRQESEIDPQNLLFHRQNIKRLEGETIRDAMLAISGRLDPTQFGASVPIHLTLFMQGRGRPSTSGPLDANGRRSIYIAVRRNFLSPMMLAFDTPIPFSTVGRRNVSNVPAQALILMNDPFVVEQAHVWAKHAGSQHAEPTERIRLMYMQAFSREPTSEEQSAALAFLQQQSSEYGLPKDQWSNDDRVWSDLAHVLFNVKEFVMLE